MVLPFDVPDCPEPEAHNYTKLPHDETADEAEVIQGKHGGEIIHSGPTNSEKNIAWLQAIWRDKVDTALPSTVCLQNSPLETRPSNHSTTKAHKKAFGRNYGMYF